MAPGGQRKLHTPSPPYKLLFIAIAICIRGNLILVSSEVVYTICLYLELHVTERYFQLATQATRHAIIYYFAVYQFGLDLYTHL